MLSIVSNGRSHLGLAVSSGNQPDIGPTSDHPQSPGLVDALIAAASHSSQMATKASETAESFDIDNATEFEGHIIFERKGAPVRLKRIIQPVRRRCQKYFPRFHSDHDGISRSLYSMPAVNNRCHGAPPSRNKEIKGESKMVSRQRNRARTTTSSARFAFVTGVAISGACMVQARAASCENLSSLGLPNTAITGAQSIPAGTYEVPGTATAYADLPAFCRVTATVSPVPGSSISIEVWLPATSWNGKYQQSGSHGFGGVLYYGEMVPQLQRGYATGVTNDGHTAGPGFDVSWAFGANVPQKITDFAWRGVHELADKAKLLIAAYYGQPPRYAYFNGCSDGGGQAMKSAQMFPRDFNGIIAGGAGAYYTHAATEQLVVSMNLKNAGIEGAAGAAILTLAQNAATAACDSKDGVADGIINNPRHCHWDPYTLICKAGQDASTCITPAQADALKANESTLRDPVTGEYLYSGMSPGSEFDQIRFGYNLGLAPFGVGNYQIAFNNPNWDGSTFDIHTDLPVLDQVLGSINAIDPDLKPFKDAGGKIIQWQGWDDAAVMEWVVRYYEQVVNTTGGGKLGSVQNFYRLFMQPGVGHCGTGVGPDDIGAENQTAASHDPENDVVSALESWVELRAAPDRLIATKFNTVDVPSSGVQVQRPICPYPSEAVYTGSGSTDDASSFVCSAMSQYLDRDEARYVDRSTYPYPGRGE